MKAPVGLLSDRTVLRSKMEGLCPDKFAFVEQSGTIKEQCFRWVTHWRALLFLCRKIQLAGALQCAVGCNADHVLNANGDQNDQCGDDEAVQHGLCAGTAE